MIKHHTRFPRWLAVLTAAVLVYMAWYVLRSDGLTLTDESGAVISSVSRPLVFLIAAAVTLAVFALFVAFSYPACRSAAERTAARDGIGKKQGKSVRETTAPTAPGAQHSCEKLFAALWLSLGLLYLLALPIMSEPDSKSHYFRATDVSEGHLISKRDADGNASGEFAIPEDWTGSSEDNVRLSAYEAAQYSSYSIREEEETVHTFNNTALYSPFSYLPQAIGLLIGRLLTGKITWIIYAGRIANFLMIGLVYLMAVTLMPYSKRYIIWAALMPMNLHQAVSLSPDGMVSALVVLMLSAVCMLRFREDARLTGRVIALLYLTSFFLSQYKIVYVGVCLLLFLIPKERFKSIRSYWTHVVILGAVVLISSLGWLSLASQSVLTQYADSHGQMMIVMKEPLFYTVVLIRTFYKKGLEYLDQLLGRYMGAFLVENNIVLIYAVLALFALISVLRYMQKRRVNAAPASAANTRIPVSGEKPLGEKLETEKDAASQQGQDASAVPPRKPSLTDRLRAGRIDLPTRILLLAVAALTILLICTSEYIQWTNYRESVVNGVQGRYFLPLIPLVLTALGGLHEDDMERDAPQYALLVGLNLCILLNVAVSFLYLTGSAVLY